MKQIFLVTLLASFIASSCKKQELASDNPMIGKWKLNRLIIVDRCKTFPSNPYFGASFDYKEVEMEISASGNISFSFENESEKLRIIKIEKNKINYLFDDNVTAHTEYKCKVKNKKGKAFTFRFYTNGSSSQIYGTYWTPDHPYFTPDMPNYASVFCTWGSSHVGGYHDEYFALYDKL